MSGGSFDYLCFKEPGDAIQSSELPAMLETLYREFPDARATQDTANLLALRDELRRRVDALRDVWQSVEWWRSGDWSRERAEQSVRDYAAAHPPATARHDSGEYTDFLVRSP